MDWIEIAVRVDAPLAEDVADVFSAFGYQGVVIERDDLPDTDPWDEANIPPATRYIVRAYLPDDETLEQAKQTLTMGLSRLPVAQPAFRRVIEEDWSQAWKVHYHPIRIGRLLVRPAWEAADLHNDDIEIVLDPGMAFGTGTHPTTQLCLRAIEGVMPAGARALDLGCGSAILAIAAAKLGAQHIYAVDNDPVAIEAAVENVERNGVTDKIEVAVGTLADVLARGEPFDFAMVNILARVIIPMCDAGLGRTVKPGGKAVFGGLIDTQTEEVEAALRRTGLEPVKRYHSGDWVLIEAERPLL